MERGQSLPKQALLRQQHPNFTGAVEVPRDIGRPCALAAEQVDAAPPDGLSRILRQPDAEKRRGRNGAFLHGGGRIGNIHIKGKHRAEREGRTIHSQRDHRTERRSHAPHRAGRNACRKRFPAPCGKRCSAGCAGAGRRAIPGDRAATAGWTAYSLARWGFPP